MCLPCGSPAPRSINTAMMINVMMNVVCTAKDVCSALPAYCSLLLLVGAAPSLSPPLTMISLY
jgi:hypothetical protein